MSFTEVVLKFQQRVGEISGWLRVKFKCMKLDCKLEFEALKL